MEDINSLLELDRQAHIKRSAKSKSRSQHNDREEYNQFSVNDLSEQVVEDIVDQMLPTFPENFPTNKCFNQGSNYFKGLCGCIDDTTEEDGASTWASSITSFMDKISEGDYSLVSDEEWSLRESKVDYKKKGGGKMLGGNKNQRSGKKHNKTPRWRKVFGGGGRSERYEC